MKKMLESIMAVLTPKLGISPTNSKGDSSMEIVQSDYACIVNWSKLHESLGRNTSNKK